MATNTTSKRSTQQFNTDWLSNYMMYKDFIERGNFILNTNGGKNYY